MRLYSPTLLIALFVLSGCAVEVEYESEYVSEVAPSYLAETEILILMHDHDLEYVYEGRPDSLIGETITLTMPIGSIMREVAGRVFQSYFMYGVVFTEEFVPDVRYIIAIEPEIRDFSYRYDRRVEQNVIDMRPTEDGIEAIPVTIITPSIQFELALTAYDSSGNVVLEKTYSSGLVSGESYIVTSRPHERINATFHASLQDIMLTVAEDIRPLLVGQPDIIDSE